MSSKDEKNLKNVMDKIASVEEPRRSVMQRVHSIIVTAAPDLKPRIWYGMPAYAKDGKVVCFFQAAVKFKARYATLGFSDEAALDDGPMWPAAYALVEWTDAVEAQVRALVTQAVG